MTRRDAESEYSLEMPVGAAAATSTSPQRSVLRHVATRQPPLAVAIATVVTVGAALVIGLGAAEVVAAARAKGEELLFWVGIVVIVNLFPVTFGELRLCLDMPVLIAVAMIYEPSVGAALAATAAIDRREFGAKIAFSHALFNRAQVSLSVYVASALFHSLAGDIYAWPTAVSATALALVTSYCANVFLVTAYTSIQLQAGWGGTGSLLRPAFALPVVGTYLGYGVLGLVLARLFFDVGSWAVVAFLLPILVARAMFVRAQTVEALARQLQEREHLLEEVLDRMVDERRDERLRISGDLHDDVLQTLIHMRLLGNVLRRDAPLPTTVLRDVEALVASADESVAALRRVMSDLRASPLGRGGLVPTLRRSVQDLRLEWGAPIRLDMDNIPDLAPRLQVALYQVAREALLNALKHANASEVSVTLSSPGNEIRLEVRDNGEGFEVGSSYEPSHLGLTLMRERILNVGGRVEILSTKKEGTAVVAAVPLNEA